jgi:hypothetical protein
MGISGGNIELLIKLRADGYFRGQNAVMEIGAQQLSNNFLSKPDGLGRLAEAFGITETLSLPPPIPTTVVNGLELLPPTAPMAREFWQWLGFKYAAIDIDGSPGSLPLDLNFDSVPPDAMGQYNLVTNFGTTEHVANQLNAFKMIHDLTAVGGLMIHEVPFQGMFNHGLVNYNCKFFWMLARSNGYKFLYTNITHSQPFNVPDNIVDFVTANNPAVDPRLRGYKAPDAGISAILEKTYDIPFVAPLDVPTGTQVENKSLRDRYWTVFDQEAFERLKKEPGGLARSRRPARRLFRFFRRALRNWDSKRAAK